MSFLYWARIPLVVLFLGFVAAMAWLSRRDAR